MADHLTETLNQRRVLVTGASSQIGVFAIPRLLDAGFHVVAVSRQPHPHYLQPSPQLQWLTFEEALHNSPACNYLLSAGPMSLAVQALRASNRYQQAVIFSSSSVLSKRNSADPKEKQLIENMRAREAELEALVKKQNRKAERQVNEAEKSDCTPARQILKMVIFRPTLIYGCGMDENISRLASLIQRYGFMPVNGKAEGLRQPVHADDLARIAVDALIFKHELPDKVLLSGGSTISYNDMVKAIFGAFDKPVRILPVPQWLLVAGIKLLKPLGLAGGVSVAMVKRQLQDLKFDNSQARQQFNFQPRPFSPRKKDFSIPGNANHDGAGSA